MARDVLVLATRGVWAAVMAAIIATVELVNIASRSAIFLVSAKFAGASVLDESECQVFGGVEVIQDLVVRGTE